MGVGATGHLWRVASRAESVCKPRSGSVTTPRRSLAEIRAMATPTYFNTAIHLVLVRIIVLSYMCCVLFVVVVVVVVVVIIIIVVVVFVVVVVVEDVVVVDVVVVVVQSDLYVRIQAY